MNEQQQAAMRQALSKIKAARDCHPSAVQTLIFEAEELLESALEQQPTCNQPLQFEQPADEPGAWMPIETAPRYGRILVSGTEIGVGVASAGWDNETPEQIRWEVVNGIVVTPTHWMPIPTHHHQPAAWVGLTDEEISNLQINGKIYWVGKEKIARAIEAKLREKNGGQP